MLENCVVFTSLIQLVKINSRISWKTRVECWKFRCQVQCLAKLDARSTGRLAALKRSARQNLLPLSKPTSLRESAWKDLFIKIMKIILLEMEWIHWVVTILHTNLFPCLKQWKYQMRQLPWIKNGKNLTRYRHGRWRKSETKKKWSLKQGMRAEQYILRR